MKQRISQFLHRLEALFAVKFAAVFTVGAEEAKHANPGKAGNGLYVQAMGTEQGGGTDKSAGRVARLFVDGQARWGIRFSK
jgi:hypothetical protein